MNIPSENKRPAELAYKKRAFIEIWLPLIIALTILGSLGILAIILMVANPETADGATKWSHISTLYLVSILCLCNLIPLGILGGLVYVLTKAPKGMINLGHTLQDRAEQLSNAATRLSDKAAEPVISVGKKSASLGSIFRRGKKPEA